MNDSTSLQRRPQNASTPSRPCLTCPPLILSFLQPPPRAMCGLRADKETEGSTVLPRIPGLRNTARRWQQHWGQRPMWSPYFTQPLLSHTMHGLGGLRGPRMLQEGRGLFAEIELPLRPKDSKTVEEQGVYLSALPLKVTEWAPAHVVGHGGRKIPLSPFSTGPVLPLDSSNIFPLHYWKPSRQDVSFNLC